MSHTALQRVVVRMLHDPSFVAAVFAHPERALADVDLTTTERDWLRSADPRRFTADPLRPRRVLKGLLDEYKASSALAVAATRRLATLDAYFASPIFHACIQSRGSMAIAFGDFLGALDGDPRIAAVARLEQALVRARRGRRPTRPAGRFAAEARWVRSSHVVPVAVHEGTLEIVQAVERVLFEISLAPIAALADDGPNLASVPQLGTTPAHYLAELDAQGNAGLSEASEGLFALLEHAAQPVAGTQLIEAARALGADPGEELDILQPLVDDGSLVRA